MCGTLLWHQIAAHRHLACQLHPHALLHSAPQRLPRLHLAPSVSANPAATLSVIDEVQGDKVPSRAQWSLLEGTIGKACDR